MSTPEMVPAETAKATAVEAARIAFQIARSYETSAAVLVRNASFNVAHDAVLAAIDALQVDAPAGLDYRAIEVDASWDIHGVHTNFKTVEFGADGATATLLVAVVHLCTTFALTETSQPSVLSKIRNGIDAACEEALLPYVSTVIYIVN